MDMQAIESLLRDALPGCKLETQAEGNKLGLSIVSDAFEGLNRVRRQQKICLLYTSPSPRDKRQDRMPSSA